MTIAPPAILRICLSAVLLWLSGATSPVLAQSTTVNHIRQADGYYADGQYAAALPLYRQGNAANAKDPDVRLRYGRCLVEGQDPQMAIKVLQSLTLERKQNPETFRWLGKAYMALADYDQALARYKTFLRTTKGDGPVRQAVKDDIVRCAYGLRMKTADEKAFAENAGPEINTIYDEYGVLNSPTVIDKIYFHSNRTASGTTFRQRADTDIFSSAILNGRWSDPRRLPPHINTTALEQACGFSADGQILYFARTTTAGTFMHTDTFTGMESVVREGSFDVPYPPDGASGDLFLFNDSICLFSSTREGGMGGHDIYFAIRRQGAWQEPQNLGPAINTPFDERFPFLTRDGRTLYFSSDRLEGAGGFDVWQADFSDEKETWMLPVNLGFPISSPGNDTWFVLAPDGMSGYMTSDRIGGYGGKDIYRIIFKQPVFAHQQISVVPTFYHVLEGMGRTSVTAVPVAPVAEKKEYFLSHLFLDGGSEVLTPQNTKKLDVLVNLMQIYPGISVELSGFESTAGQRMYNLYFSVRQAEKAAAYLEQKGIGSDRILIKGYGASFPILTPSAATSTSALAQRLGRRIEITPLDYAGEPVEIHVERIQVPEQVKDPAYRIWQDTRSGLHYSVQIAATTQMLQNADLDPRDFLHIEYDKNRNLHKYLTGWTSTYRDAELERQAMLEMGFLQAFIVPYVDGRRLDSKRAFELAAQFPDLNNYLAARQK